MNRLSITLLLLYLSLIEISAQTLAKHASTISITVKVFSGFDSSAVKNYAAALYDSSGIRIDSLVATDTSVTTFPNVVITGVNSSGETPTGFYLGQNYPNPFNPTSRIAFTVPQSGPVTFRTYNILGQEDASLEMTLEPGNYEVEYEPGGAAGVLFYQLITKDYTETRKMIQFGGEKPGRSRLRLFSSGMHSQTEAYRKAADDPLSNFILKLYNLPSTFLPIVDLTLHVTGLSRDTTLNLYVTEAKALPCPGRPTVSFAGKIYTTVLIGSQCWFQENIDVGTMIPGIDSAKDNGTIEKYCYNNDLTYCNGYGGLYLWYEAMQYSTTSTQGICPSGWHIPTRAEFATLITTVAGDGDALLAMGQGTGTNTSGFSGVLAGARGLNGINSWFGLDAFFWASTAFNDSYSDHLQIYNVSGSPYLDNTGNKVGFSIRCLKD